MTSIKLLLILGFAGIAALCSTREATANGNGKSGATVGCTCHGNGYPNKNTTISVESSSNSFSVEPGGTLSLKAIVAHNVNNYFGVDIAVRTTADPYSGSSGQGALAAASSETGLRLSSKELTHKMPKKGVNNTANFTFTWKAPNTPGTYYLHIAAVAANGDDRDDSADQWNLLAPIAFTVSATDVAELGDKSSFLIEAAPNPANEQITLNFDLEAADNCSISVLDYSGALVYETKQYFEAGRHGFNWNSRDLQGNLAASGQYIALIRANRRVAHIPISISR